MLPCIECDGQRKLDANNPCVRSAGACGHAYHLHCVSKWLREHSGCPTCGAEWRVDNSALET